MSQDQQFQDERQKLIRECDSLIRQIASKAYSLKLLSAAKKSLEAIANYKNGRIFG